MRPAARDLRRPPITSCSAQRAAARTFIMPDLVRCTLMTGTFPRKRFVKWRTRRLRGNVLDVTARPRRSGRTICLRQNSEFSTLAAMYKKCSYADRPPTSCGGGSLRSQRRPELVITARLPVVLAPMRYPARPSAFLRNWHAFPPLAFFALLHRRAAGLGGGTSSESLHPRPAVRRC
jgi:hypothetical protein